MSATSVRQRSATGSKKTRAEPLGTAYERGRVHHLNVLPELEEQLTSWVTKDESGYSPDRLDAAVWSAMPLLFPETLKGGLPGSARTQTPNSFRRLSGTRQVSVPRAAPRR